MTKIITDTAPAIGATIAAVDSSGTFATGTVIKSYVGIGVAVATLDGSVVMIESGTEYTNVPA